MGYITKNYLKTQFNNFADRIASVFARKTDVPTKTSQLQNDSGFKTTDSNITYALSKSGSTITLTGSDGSKTSVTDSDTNTTYGNMKAATASAAGKAGLVPAPAAGKQNAYFRGDGTYVTPSTTLTGTVPGIPLDQTMGKKLNDKIENVSSSLGGCSLEQEGENFYIVGADSVRKKLGSGILKRTIVLSHTRFTGSTTVNIAKQLNNYKELTKDNFFVNSINSNTTGFYFGYVGMGFSYNQETGILTITAPNVVYEMSVVAVYVE